LEVKDALVTNRKCGTCRFYEVGAQQTHGWCRNPAYPRRDDVALLRNDELACRSGWGKDFWALRGAGDGAAEPISPLIDETTQPIPVPIGTGIAEHQVPALAAAAPPTPAATGIPPRHAARQDGVAGAPHTVSTPARVLTPAPKDGTMKTTPPLSGHPELNELGVPIRSPKRSSVAEAHRRAMERRAQERQTKEDRDRLASQAALKQADADREQQLLTKVTEPAPEERPINGGLNDFGTPPLSPSKPPIVNTPREEHTAPKRELNRVASGATKRELTRPDIAAPTLPRPVPTPVATRDEAVDVIISTGEQPKELPKAPIIAPAFTPDTNTPQQAERNGFRSFNAVPEPPLEVPPVSAAVNTPLPQQITPVKEPRQAPYWDQPGVLKGFGRFRSDTALAAAPDRTRDGQPVRKVGRQTPGEPKPTSTRAIKPLGGSLLNTSAVEEAREIAPPTRPATPVEVQQTIIAPPPPPPADPAPRQIDESLLRQLENGWQAQQLEVHTGQRCGTCRFFQPTELGRGSCNCPFAPVHRQQTESEGLPCATALGVWWATPDEGWLERAERRPRRATPLLDALLREREAMEPLRAAPPLRRGAR